MSYSYNLPLLYAHHVTLYDLEKHHIASGYTCNSLSKNGAIRTDTLLKILEYSELNLEDFLICTRNPAQRKEHGILDLRDMVTRCVISETSRLRYLRGQNMSLETLEAMAADQGALLTDLLKTEPAAPFLVAESSPLVSGPLKNKLKMVYLLRW